MLSCLAFLGTRRAVCLVLQCRGGQAKGPPSLADDPATSRIFFRHSIGPLNWSAADRARSRDRRDSAAAANILQLCSRSGLLRKEWILVSRRRIGTVFGRFHDLWRKRRIVTGEARAGIVDRSAMRFRGGRRQHRCAPCRREQERYRPCDRSDFLHAEYPILICSCWPRTDARRSRPEEHPTRTNASAVPRLRPSRKQRAHRPGPFSSQRRLLEPHRHP